MSNQRLENLFPNLKQSSYSITSPKSFEYNCIAWVAGETDTWWWPDPNYQYFWPTEVSRSETLGSFIKAFATIGYQVCDSPVYEEGFEKVAIYGDKKWREITAKVGAWFISGEVKYFESEDEALTWIDE